MSLNELLKWLEEKGIHDFARVYHFSFSRDIQGIAVNFSITVRDYLTVENGNPTKYLATSDQFTLQQTGTNPYQPYAFGATMEEAIRRCVRSLMALPYEDESLKEQAKRTSEQGRIVMARESKRLRDKPR
ncbi:MAG: hypothetical protein AB1489_21225 [Acidobacteriota bacterium]